jgi:hypothetical protein
VSCRLNDSPINSILVPSKGVEPLILSALVFETNVYAQIPPQRHFTLLDAKKTLINFVVYQGFLKLYLEINLHLQILDRFTKQETSLQLLQLYLLELLSDIHRFGSFLSLGLFISELYHNFTFFLFISVS